MVFLNIIGGIALILFGIRFLRKGLDRLFGYGLHNWLERTARRPWKAALAGLGFGTVAPSSTAQTLLTLQLLKTGKLSVESTLAFLLAANAGISVMVQLLAIRVFDAFAVFLVLGVLGFQVFRSEKVRGIGQALLGLGFIFLAMALISGAAKELAQKPGFLTALQLLTEYRVLVMLFAAGFTFCCQSSTATIGLALALAGTGHVTLGVFLPVVLGANLGIGFTSLAAGYFTREGRALAIMNLLVKGLLVVPALIWFPGLVAVVDRTPGDLTQQAANFHSAFGVLAALLGVVLASPLGKILRRVTGPASATSNEIGAVTSCLDPEALSTPLFALANATRETLRLGDEVKSMLENAWVAFENTDLDLARRVKKHDDRIDEVHAAIKRYLSQLPMEAMSRRDSHLQFGLLNFVSQLEVIGDLVDKALCGVVEKSIHQPVSFSAADQTAMRELYGKLHTRFQTALSVLAMHDAELAQKFLEEGDQLKQWCIDAQKAHYQRLKNRPQSSELESSERFIDVMNVLRRMSGLLNTIGHTFTLEPVRESAE